MCLLSDSLHNICSTKQNFPKQFYRRYTVSNIFQALKFVPIAVVVIIFLILILSGYVKAPPDVAYIISGFRKTRILVGKAGIT